MGPWATQDELSDYETYPYHTRLVPPDFYQTKVISEYLQSMGWVYFSVVYVESSYGYNANRNMAHWAKEYGLCIAGSYGLTTTSPDEDYINVVNKMAENPNARVVVVFVYYPIVLQLMDYIRAANLVGQFIWIISECFADVGIEIVKDAIPSSLRLLFYDAYNEAFNNHMDEINPSNSDNPHVEEYFVQTFGCSSTDQGNNSCSNHSLTELGGYFSTQSERYVDSVHVLARAFHNLVSDHCPEAFAGQRDSLESCITGEKTLQYIREVMMQRPSRYISFNKDGDAMRDYTFMQILTKPKFHYNHILTIDPEGNATYYNKPEWSGLKMNAKELQEGQPISVCSEPCLPGQIYLQGELQCCWTCYTCADNEITNANSTFCLPCPELQWPDPESNLFSCELITPSYMTVKDTYGLVLMVLTAIGLAAVLLCFVLLVYHRNKKIIKASNTIFMHILLLGATLGLAAVPLMFVIPTASVCAAARHLLEISLTVSFATLLVKTAVIYRIFNESEKFNQKLRCVGKTCQLPIPLVIVSVQVRENYKKYLVVMNASLEFNFM